jgi:hypothetical protein
VGLGLLMGVVLLLLAWLVWHGFKVDRLMR